MEWRLVSACSRPGKGGQEPFQGQAQKALPGILAWGVMAVLGPGAGTTSPLSV